MLNCDGMLDLLEKMENEEEPYKMTNHYENDYSLEEVLRFCADKEPKHHMIRLSNGKMVDSSTLWDDNFLKKEKLMFVICNWEENQLGYNDFPYTNICSYKRLNEALEALKSNKNYNVLFRYRDELDYIFFDFQKNEFIEWDYTTGNEDANILGSGSSYYNTVRTSSFEEAMKFYKDGRDYLTREVRVNGQYHTQYYDNILNTFIETR